MIFFVIHHCAVFPFPFPCFNGGRKMLSPSVSFSSNKAAFRCFSAALRRKLLCPLGISLLLSPPTPPLLPPLLSPPSSSSSSYPIPPLFLDPLPLPLLLHPPSYFLILPLLLPHIPLLPSSSHSPTKSSKLQQANSGTSRHARTHKQAKTQSSTNLLL